MPKVALPNLDFKSAMENAKQQGTLLNMNKKKTAYLIANFIF